MTKQEKEIREEIVKKQTIVFKRMCNKFGGKAGSLMFQRISENIYGRSYSLKEMNREWHSLVYGLPRSKKKNKFLKEIKRANK